ncbi:uncharacterized protein LOC134531076 isoform X2 [Bacillus rossius redtenbacheri]|uniref:uncharacterized protein LOC134531076 isoform X2 n=1 Tax=Bacillus rossius redtenbacheri TaxID=93214 RepID=UPI002FDEAA6D
MRVFHKILILLIVTVTLLVLYYAFETEDFGELYISVRSSRINGNATYNQSQRLGLLEISSSMNKSYNISVIANNRTNYYNVWCIFTKVTYNAPLKEKFKTFTYSLVKKSSVDISYHVITDNSSKNVAEDIIGNVRKTTSKLLEVTYYDAGRLAHQLTDIVTAMQPHFSSQPGTYYSDALFFLSLGLHHIAANQSRAAMFDADTKLLADVAELFRHFDRTMTSTKRSQAFRERLKQDPAKYEAYLIKERERFKLRRDQQKRIQTDKELKLKRKQDRIRQRKHRENKKSQTVKSNSNVLPEKSSYRSNRSLGKAVCKLKRILPHSPGKRKAVVAKLLVDELPEYGKRLNLLHKMKKEHGQRLNEETKAKVTQYYLRDDISRTEPGRKDKCTVKNVQSGKKDVVQKRTMMMTIAEAYEEFVKEYPDCKIKKSKFFELRPQFVYPVSTMSHNTCVCHYHANMHFLVESLAKEVNVFPHSTNDLLAILVCDVERFDCMLDICEKCKLTCNSVRDVISQYDEETLTNEMKWKQWKNVEGHPQIVSETGTVSDCVKKIQMQMIAFKLHQYVKRKQSKHFEDAKKNFSTHDAVIQIDFAENYTAVSQDEIQSAHWTQRQTTIFTAVVWLECNKVYNYAIISDELSHDKYSVWTFLKTLIQDSKQKMQNIHHVKIFSDGCAAQFKNRFTVVNLTYFQTDCNISADWNYFATSHGKGAVNGVGGTLKRTVWRKVKSRQEIVNSPVEFFQCTERNVKGVTVIFISAEEVKSSSSLLDERWEKVQPIPHLHKVHFVSPVRKGVVEVSTTSEKTNLTTVVLQDLSEENEDEDDDEKEYGVEDSDKEDVTDEKDVDEDSDFEGGSEGTYLQNNVKFSSSCSKKDKNSIEPGAFVLVSLTPTGKFTRKQDYFAVVMEYDEESNQVLLKYMHPSGKSWVWPANEDASWEDISVILKKVNSPTLLNNRGQFSFM